MNKYAFAALKTTLVIMLLFGLAMAIFAAYEFLAEEPNRLKLVETHDEKIRRIVNESIKCFEMPEEEIKLKAYAAPLAAPAPPRNQDYYIYYVSYFYNNNQGGAEITMTRQITCWADLYTAEDSVQNQLKKIIKDVNTFVIIQYSLLRYISEE